jgi:hypothetical protein
MCARSATAVLIAVAVLAVVSGAAAGQSQPPPPPGELPPPTVEPPPPTVDLPPPTVEPPPPITEPPGDPQPEDPPVIVDPPPSPNDHVAPTRVVELVTREASVHGRRLTVAIRCRDSGFSTLRRGDRRLARASFTCADFSASVSFRLRARDARALGARRRTRLTARFRVGSASIRHSIVVRAPRATLSAASTTDWRSSWVSCGNRFGAYPGLSIDPGSASSYDGRDDEMAYSYFIYTPDVGWTQYGPGGPAVPAQKWSGKSPAPAGVGGWDLGGSDHFGLRPGNAAWAYVLVLKYWYRARHFEWVYPSVDSYLGGFVYGRWCYWMN